MHFIRSVAVATTLFVAFSSATTPAPSDIAKHVDAINRAIPDGEKYEDLVKLLKLDEDWKVLTEIKTLDATELLAIYNKIKTLATPGDTGIYADKTTTETASATDDTLKTACKILYKFVATATDVSSLASIDEDDLVALLAQVFVELKEAKGKEKVIELKKEPAGLGKELAELLGEHLNPDKWTDATKKAKIEAIKAACPRSWPPWVKVVIGIAIGLLVIGIGVLIYFLLVKRK